jgi:UDP-GlcNAc:undecaprenyl-phosphate GlcNAc-1-phosphate transferase
MQGVIENSALVDPATNPLVAERLRQIAQDIGALAEKQRSIEESLRLPQPTNLWDIFNGYIGVFIVSFVITLLATPIMRRLAISNGIIDRPNEARKMHKLPIAYLGGVAVYLGIVAGIGFSYAQPYHGLISWHKITNLAHLNPDEGVVLVPMSILVGLTIIMLIGLLDDVINVTPMQKVGGMLVAAAALAMQDVGVKVAQQVLTGAGALVNDSLADPLNWAIDIGLPFNMPLIGGNIHLDIIYWTGTAVIAIFVLGACNAINLIDGLDGLCSGISTIAGAALLVIALTLASYDDGRLDAARIVLCLALMGACMGFLPHNYNPASIFLGDSGSLMLGYLIIVIVLTLGDTGRTNLVLCGLIIFAVPIIDTSLAIVRRKLAGQPISAADDNHLHHILKRMLGVKGAVTVLYAMGAAFGVMGVALQSTKARVVYALVLVIAAFIGVIALKSARKKQLEEQAAASALPAGAPPILGAPVDGAAPTQEPIVKKA